MSVNDHDVIEQVGKHDFRDRYCARYRCQPRDFEARLFRRCLHRRALLFSWLVKLLRPNFFESDWAFMRDAALARDDQELQMAIRSYKLYCHRDHTFLHDTLKFRVSCRKVSRSFTALTHNAPPLL